MPDFVPVETHLDQPGLIPIQVVPENLESPISALYSWQTPNDLFYLRNHLPYPAIDIENWKLSIAREANNVISFSYDELRNMPIISKFVTLECSGNKRGLMEPMAQGDQWKIGAIGNAKWTGVPLSYLLDQTGIIQNAKEIVFSGVDVGLRPDIPGEFHFERSLPFEISLLNECMIALEMNDQPIPYKHGFPARLIVPGWYGMAHVKWLDKINVINEPFKGPFQVVDYVYITNEDDYSGATPVTEIKVNSIITWPSKGEIIKPGVHTVKGLAWAGKQTIDKIEVSTDDGTTWHRARLASPEHSPYTWTFWEFNWTVNSPGHYFISVRAQDSAGNLQPRQAAWNVKGYANNSIHKVEVIVPGEPKYLH